MKIIVTGAAGFIGSHLSEKLIQENHTVIGIDNFDPFYPRSIKENNIRNLKENSNFELIEGDITDYQFLSDTLNPIEGIDCIVHLAAKAGVRPSLLDPMGAQKANVEGTQHLLELAKEKKIQQFVFASSSSVYGVNENTPWSESDFVLQPISPYASTKISAELLGHVYSHLYNIRFIGLRFFTVYGPRQRPDLAIHKFINLMMKDEPIPLFGDGSTRRDYTYVGDIVDGIMAAINYTESKYEIINLGNHQTVSLIEMVTVLEEVTGKKAQINWLPMQPGDVPITYANVEKAGKLLNYHPKTAFKMGVHHLVNWKMKN
jgi:UDP-glucuronate 4-epimerase